MSALGISAVALPVAAAASTGGGTVAIENDEGSLGASTTTAAVVSGGTVTQRGSYTLLTFTESGSFTVNSGGTLQAQILAVGGGRGGGYYTNSNGAGMPGLEGGTGIPEPGGAGGAGDESYGGSGGTGGAGGSGLVVVRYIPPGD